MGSRGARREDQQLSGARDKYVSVINARYSFNPLHVRMLVKIYTSYLTKICMFMMLYLLMGHLETEYITRFEDIRGTYRPMVGVINS